MILEPVVSIQFLELISIILYSKHFNQADFNQNSVFVWFDPIQLAHD